jgi:hypothetical protein
MSLVVHARVQSVAAAAPTELVKPPLQAVDVSIPDGQ